MTAASLALATDQAKSLGVGVLIAVVVIGAVIAAVITKIIVRIVTVIVVVVLAVLVWTQRSSVENAARKCDATFFGVHLTPSDPTVKRRCQQVTNR